MMPGISAAAPALGDEQGVAAREYLADALARNRIAHHGARRDRQVEVGPRLSGHVFALAMLPALGLPLGAVAVIEQRREVCVGAQEDTAAGSAVSAVRPAFGDELFAAERGSSRATRPADYMDDRPIYKHCGLRIA